MTILLQVDTINDRKDFDTVRNAMKVLHYTTEQIDQVWKLVAAIIHLVSAPSLFSLSLSLILICIHLI